MKETSNVRELLRSLQPEGKPRKEKWTKVITYLPEISQARERGVTWAMIAQTLRADGIEVSAAHLRLFISRMTANSKTNVRTKSGRVSRSTVARNKKSTDNVTSDVSPDVTKSVDFEEATKVHSVAAKTAVEPSPTTHAGPRRQHQRV